MLSVSIKCDISFWKGGASHESCTWIPPWKETLAACFGRKDRRCPTNDQSHRKWEIQSFFGTLSQTVVDTRHGSQHIVLEGKEWRTFRANWSPVFSAFKNQLTNTPMLFSDAQPFMPSSEFWLLNWQSMSCLSLSHFTVMKTRFILCPAYNWREFFWSWLPPRP